MIVICTRKYHSEKEIIMIGIVLLHKRIISCTDKYRYLADIVITKSV